MAVTPNGWPYVVPSDHPLEYPTVSQALANKLEAVKLPAKSERGSRGVLSADYAEVSGIKTIPHSLGAVPTTITVTPANAALGVAMQKLAYHVFDATAGQFQVVVVDTTNGNSVTNVSQRIAFYYQLTA